MPESVSITLVQDSFLVGDVRGNADRIIEKTLAEKQKGASLVVFPELALTGYPPEDLLYRDGFLRQVNERIGHIAESTRGVDVILGAPWLQGDELYNSALWCRDGDIRMLCSKQLLPNYSVFDEKRYFEAGSGSCVVEFKGHKIGLLICEDIWQPQPVEDLHRNGTDLAIVINASPFHIGRFEERIEVLKSRIKESAIPIAYLNLVGAQDELVFDGQSVILNAKGDIVCQAPAFVPDVLRFSFSTQKVLVSLNGMLHVEPPASELVYRGIVLAVREFVNNNGFRGVVVGLSGGVDSALTLAIAVDALGAHNVLAVMMPSPYTSDMSLEDAEEQAKTMGVEYQVLPIDTLFDSFKSSLASLFDGLEADTTEENIQARIRGVLLMAISNKFGRMVLTTGNKSELAVGYATLYGDMSGGYAPLKDVCKTLVYELCRYRNAIEVVIPQRVLDRPPTAELAPGQVDQDSLPEYDILDQILERSVENDEPASQLVKDGFDAELVEKVKAMVQGNEYKRRQSAPGVRITRRAFGRDRRYPITSGYQKK